MKLSDTLGITLGTLGIIFIFITLWFFYVGCKCTACGESERERKVREHYERYEEMKRKEAEAQRDAVPSTYQPPAKPAPLNVAPTDIRFEERRPEEGGPGSIRRGC